MAREGENSELYLGHVAYSSSGEKCQVDNSLYQQFLEEMKIGDKPSTIVLP